MNPPIYASKYSDSHALIIGIDKYSKISQLDYAASDAKSIADILVTKLNFPRDHVTVLLDQEATKENILAAYFKLVPNTHPDDRVVIFFCGPWPHAAGQNARCGISYTSRRPDR